MGNSLKKKDGQKENKAENETEVSLVFDLDLPSGDDEFEVERNSTKGLSFEKEKEEPAVEEDDSGFVGLDLSDIDTSAFEEGTQKTIVINHNDLKAVSKAASEEKRLEEKTSDDIFGDISAEGSGSSQILSELLNSVDSTSPTIHFDESTFEASSQPAEIAEELAEDTDTGSRIEATIKDIVNPRFDLTQERSEIIDLDKLNASSDEAVQNISQMEDSELSFREDTSSNEFELGPNTQEMFSDATQVASISKDDLLAAVAKNNQTSTGGGFELPEVSNAEEVENLIENHKGISLDLEKSGMINLAPENANDNSDNNGNDDKFELEGDGRTTEFKYDRPQAESTLDLTAPEPEAVAEIEEEIPEETHFSEEVNEPTFSDLPKTLPEELRVVPPTFVEKAPEMGGGSSEDALRFQATIRALREEREELLSQLKLSKNALKESEQDNLTLRANLDEAKIEITILRKRHLNEIEELKYKASANEEKRLLAEEKAKQAELKREKLEQKVRIDFNQVKQREKELESKLELLSMDVDSQVQSRDQKILELRRKIDALEFNIENASIKEQKSYEDKRKLEDRLGKVMKTLRQSIKNLEEDIEDRNENFSKEKN